MGVGGVGGLPTVTCILRVTGVKPFVFSPTTFAAGARYRRSRKASRARQLSRQSPARPITPPSPPPPFPPSACAMRLIMRLPLSDGLVMEVTCALVRAGGGLRWAGDVCETDLARDSAGGAGGGGGGQTVFVLHVLQKRKSVYFFLRTRFATVCLVFTLCLETH